MPEILHRPIYDFPKYYDLVFGSDWKPEFDFLRACFAKHATRSVESVFEPACGTGRLLIKFAEAGYTVCGLDLNPKAVNYCNARFQRRGLEPRAFVADMADFRLPHKVDATFNPINSFRELVTEQQAHNHLQCVADCLVSKGLYVLAMHLTPTEGPHSEAESWSARRGNLAVISHMWSKNLDLRRRRENFGLAFDVYTLTNQFRIEQEMVYRTYIAQQMRSLLRKVPQFRLIETYDFAYDIETPITIDAQTEDVVFILEKQ